MDATGTKKIPPKRPRMSMASVVVLLAVAITLLYASGPILGGIGSGAAGRGGDGMPMTAWGHPDLQGTWSNATVTPFERPRGQGPVLTPEEARAIEEGRAARVQEDAALDPDRPPPPEGGTNPVCIDAPTSCYNQVYIDQGEHVAVVNGEYRSSLLTIPADGRMPPVTEAARARSAEFRARTAEFGQYDHPELRPLGERCILSFGSSAGPPMLPNYWYNNNYTIAQSPDAVVIMAEMVHDARIIKLGEPKPLPADMKLWTGDSWGRWEGNTLVIETTNIHPEQTIRGARVSDSFKMIERLTRVSEDTILYEFYVDDPETWTEPWGGQVPFWKQAGRVYEYACHEGNYAMANILSGARYEERMAAREGESASR